MIFRPALVIALMLGACSEPVPDPKPTEDYASALDRKWRSGWRYQVFTDRISGSKTYSASVEGDQGRDTLGGVLLNIGDNSDAGSRVILTNLPNLPEYGVTTIRYKTDAGSGNLTARPGRSGESLNLFDPDGVVSIIRRSKYLILDIPGSGQPKFKTANLVWPLAKAPNIEPETPADE